ncbi:MAG: nucleotidyltransferase family protein, partial [Lachnospiraceae bacterium]|nr:nucleotidyltransferase family protein [Lachnospiraceae bacterium]
VVRDGVASGMSYPKARAEAMKLVLSGDDEEAFETMLENTSSFELQSNDVLGLEYIKAVKRQGDCFEVGCIRRNLSLPSAHSIRDAILQNELSCVAAKENLAPESMALRQVEEGSRTTAAELSASPLRGIRGAAHQGYATLDMLSDMLGYRLLQLVYLDSAAPEEHSVLCDYLDVSREIADALRKQVRERMSFRERIAAVKSRNYTYSRISRALLHIILDIQRKDHAALRGAYFGEAEMMPYVRVLGVRKEAKELLAAIATTAVTSPARYQRTLDALRRQTIESPEDLLASIRAGHAEFMFRSDLYAADLYRLIYHTYSRDTEPENEFTRRFMIID